jgi:hypothetical protein
LNAIAAAIAGSSLAAEPLRSGRKKLAIVTTEWRYHSHAWHMGERFLAGYPVRGHWHRPPLAVVSAYVDQTPKNDLSRQRSQEFGFPIYPTIAEALRCGTDRLAVDAVLIIGEHGNYPNNDIGQKQYPRYEFFKQVVDVFQKDGKTTPIFNDKHLSWTIMRDATKMTLGRLNTRSLGNDRRPHQSPRVLLHPFLRPVPASRR